MDAIAPDILKLLWPVIGVMATGLLGLLSFMCRRILKKFDEVCVTLVKVLEDHADTRCRVAVLETRCDLMHKGDQ